MSGQQEALGWGTPLQGLLQTQAAKALFEGTPFVKNLVYSRKAKT